MNGRNNEKYVVKFTENSSQFRNCRDAFEFTSLEIIAGSMDG